MQHDDGADYEQMDALLREEAYLRHEFARAAADAAKCGGHPEAAAGLERALLTVAELPIIPERDDAQPDLFQHAA